MPSSARRKRRDALLSFATAPLLAGAVLLAPCTCPNHQGEAMAAGHMSHASMGAMGNAAPATALAASLTSSVPVTPELLQAANAKLSRDCRKLIAVKRPSRLSTRKRARRRHCIVQRRKIIETLATQQPGQPVATSPTSTTPTATTPTGGSGSGGGACGNPCYAAVGVTAIDNNVAFRLTRGVVSADIVSFELNNMDAQSHNLYYATADSTGNVNGPLKQIIANTPPPDPGMPGRLPSAEVRMAPGRYKLICTIAGHGPMAVDFTVNAPS